MSDKLAKRVEENKSFAERNVSTAISASQETINQQNAWLTMGGIMVINHIAQALNAQTIRGVQRIRDEELYKPLGFSRFDDFLDEWNESPMTYKKFNEQEKLLMREGDALFDVLSSVKLSMRQRRMLGAGNIQLEGENVIIKSVATDGAEEKTESVSLSDRTRLIQILSAVTDQNFLLNDKNIKQKEKIERGEKQIETLQKKIDAGYGNGTSQLAHFEMNMRVMSQLNQYVDFVKNDLTLVEKERDGETYLNGLWVAFNRLRDAYGRTDLDFSTGAVERKPLGEMNNNEISRHVAKRMKGFKEEPQDDEFAKITKDINDDDLADLMED